MVTDTTNWLIDWFGHRGNIPGDTLEEKLRVNYFNASLIDSLGIIEMITTIESYFKISFSEKHFQDRRFSTIGGLSEIIAELSNSTGEE